MRFFKKQPEISRDQQLSSRPVRIVDDAWSDGADGGGKITVPIARRKMWGGLIKMPEGASKTYEFDALGKFVWDQCDGKTSVQQIARRLAKQYKISERESLVATEQFLTTLAKRGLIAAVVGKDVSAGASE